VRSFAGVCAKTSTRVPSQPFDSKVFAVRQRSSVGDVPPQRVWSSG